MANISIAPCGVSFDRVGDRAGNGNGIKMEKKMNQKLQLVLLGVLFSACTTGDYARLDRDVLVRSSRGFAVQAFEISAESDCDGGSRAWNEESQSDLRMTHCRYIGYPIPVSPQNQGGSHPEVLLKKGEYKSQHAKTFSVRGPFNEPISLGNRQMRHCGYPGIACAILSSKEEIPDHDRDNPPFIQKNDDGTTTTIPVARDHYQAGSLGGLTVDFPYEYMMEKLLADRKPITGRLSYFVRGAHHSKVYYLTPLWQPAGESESQWKGRLGRVSEEILSERDQVTSERARKSLTEIHALVEDILSNQVSPLVTIQHAKDSTEKRPVVEMVFNKP